MAWPDNIFRWLGFGRFNSVLPTIAEGAVEELQVDQRGRLRVAIETGATRAPASVRYLSSAAERTAQAATGARTVREVQVINTAAATRYLQLFDRTDAPPGGAAPIYRALVPPGAQVGVVFDGGRAVTNGLRVVLSSTAATYTDPSADEGLFYAELD